MKKLSLLFILCVSVTSAALAQGKLIETQDPAVARMEGNRKTIAPFSVLFNKEASYKEQDAQFWNLGELGHQEAEQHAFSGAGHAADEGIARIFFALPILPENDLMQVQIVRRHRRGTKDRNSIAPRIARRFAHIEVMHGCKTGEITRGNLRLTWTP